MFFMPHYTELILHSPQQQPVCFHFHSNSRLHSCRITAIVANASACKTLRTVLEVKECTSVTSNITSLCVSTHASALTFSCRVKTLTEKASEWSLLASIFQCKRKLLFGKKNRKKEEEAQKEWKKEGGGMNTGSPAGNINYVEIQN